MQRKKVLDEHDIQDILQICKMGIWRIEFSETEAPKFYADLVMNQLIGTPEDMDPEKRFREDLGFSSLDFMSLLGELEDTFDIELEEEDALQVRTIGEALALLEKECLE